MPKATAIVAAGRIRPLVSLLKDGPNDGQTAALTNLASDYAANKVAIAKAGDIAPLFR